MSSPTEITADMTGLPEDDWTLPEIPSECRQVFRRLTDEGHKLLEHRTEEIPSRSEG